MALLATDYHPIIPDYICYRLHKLEIYFTRHNQWYEGI